MKCAAEMKTFADRLRHWASEADSPHSKDGYLELAVLYDRMAERSQSQEQRLMESDL